MLSEKPTKNPNQTRFVHKIPSQDPCPFGASHMEALPAEVVDSATFWRAQELEPRAAAPAEDPVEGQRPWLCHRASTHSSENVGREFGKGSACPSPHLALRRTALSLHQYSQCHLVRGYTPPAPGVLECQECVPQFTDDSICKIPVK